MAATCACVQLAKLLCPKRRQFAPLAFPQHILQYANSLHNNVRVNASVTCPLNHRARAYMTYMTYMGTYSTLRWQQHLAAFIRDLTSCCVPSTRHGD